MDGSNKRTYTNTNLWSVIHLFGYDHKKIKDFDKMIKIENKFLSYLN